VRGGKHPAFFSRLPKNHPPVNPRGVSDEGSPIQLRGLDITPSRLPQKNLKSFLGKRRRSLTKGVRDDTSCRLERGTFAPSQCWRFLTSFGMINRGSYKRRLFEMRDNVYSIEHSYKDGGFWVLIKLHKNMPSIL
jgi:hypothetical protein